MKKSAILMLLCLLAVSAGAQNMWDRIVKILESTPVVDTEYIFTRPARFAVDGNLNLKNFTVRMTTDFTSRENADSVLLPVTSSMNFTGGIKKGFGLGVAYGNLALGYGFSLGANDKKSGKTFDFGIKGHKWGVSLSYYSLNHYAHSWTTRGNVDDAQYMRWERVSNEPCDVFRLAIDAYWTLKRKRFAYTAAYKSGMVQRRSAGSFLIGGNFLVSGMECDEKDQMFYSSGIRNYTFYQTSVGVGYSYNWVLYHRDPYDPKTHGMRNLTFNATVQPLLTFSNGVNLKPVGNGDPIVLLCPISPNLNASAAITYSYGQLFLSLQYTYGLLYFHSPSNLTPATLNLQDRPIEEVSFYSLVQDWCLKAIVVFNF